MKKESISARVKLPQNNHRKDSYNGYFTGNNPRLQSKNQIDERRWRFIFGYRKLFVSGIRRENWFFRYVNETFEHHRYPSVLRPYQLTIAASKNLSNDCCLRGRRCS